MEFSRKKIESFKELESFLKKHDISYPKSWRSKFRSVKRKDKNSSIWKDYRICVYGAGRIFHCLVEIKKEMVSMATKITNKTEQIGKKKFEELILKHDLTVGIIKTKIWPEIISVDSKNYFTKVIKKGGKSYYKRNLTPEVLRFEELLNIKIPELIKLPKKKQTVTKIMMEDEGYWDVRHKIMGRIKEDMYNKSIVRKEAQEYFKSVCTYIKQPKYNKKFFINHSKPITKDWNNYWDFFLKVR